TRWGLGVWAAVASRPWLYRLVTGAAARALALVGRGRGRFAFLPLAGGWTRHRDMPAPEGKTFMAAWAARKREGARQP
ncbi:DUF3390 domain-containing protein, partial [Mycobacterium tuberculosis]|nr:DUF3390 domain-containing protein [Mycobacterium tuberculosis]